MPIPTKVRGSKNSLFDHLVGGGEQRRRHGKTEDAGGLDVDDQLKFGCLHHRQVGGFLALEDAAGIDAGEAVGVQSTAA